MLREDRRSEPRVRERVPYVVVYGSPGLPLIQLVRRLVNVTLENYQTDGTNFSVIPK